MNEIEKKLWVEKYRPKTVNECILSVDVKKQFLSFVENRDCPHLLLVGTAGTGKTTIARALCHDIDYEVIVINASDERNMDLIRTRIRNFASQTSLEQKEKAIILDEADGLSAIAQSALRAAMEEFHYVRFILTANYPHKLIEALRSRTSIISFNISKEKSKPLKVAFLKRVFTILESENIEYDKAVVGAVISKYYPDNRRILNELQRYANGYNTIDTGMLSVIDSFNVTTLVEHLKKRDVGEIRRWVANNSDVEPEYIFRQIYETFYDALEPESVPELVIELAKYQFQAVQVADQEINTFGFLMEVLGNMTFKDG